MKTFAETLSAVVKAKRFTLKEISQGTGIPRTNLSEWIAGRSPHLSPELLKLAQFLGVSLEFLLTGQDKASDVVQQVLRKTEIQAGKYLVTIERVEE